jgi:translation initiation factor IF-3
MEKFLQAGNKVKVTVRMRGRERIHPELAAGLVTKVVDRLKDISTVERPVSAERSDQISIILSPTRGAVSGK